MAERKAEVSDAAVRKATGKTWKEWFALLDRQDAQKLAHKDIAKLLREKYLDSGWWCQTVTLMYERARRLRHPASRRISTIHGGQGLRELHQTADGFVANVNKTFNVSLDKLYDAWKDLDSRGNWLAEHGIEITRQTVNKSMRMVWSDGVSRVLVSFYPKGKDKAQVSVQHSRLESAAGVAEAKSEWKQALERLQKKLAQYG